MPYREIEYDTGKPVGYPTLNNPERIHALALQVAEASALALGIGKQAFLEKRTPEWKNR